MTRPATLIAAFLTLLLLACYAETGKAHPWRGAPASGKPHDRAAWLQGAVAYHRYVAENGGGRHQLWHRRALAWTTRELREAEQDAWRYDHAVPEWPWLALARCEQSGDGWAGVNWQAYSQKYEGAYGFLHSTWRDYRYPGMPASAVDATPREQTLVAIRLRATFGGYSSWPACSRRLGLR